MDWFKVFHRQKSPLKFATQNGGLSVAWLFKFTDSLKSDYTPDMQVQIFEKGFSSSQMEVDIKALEYRIVILTVPGKVGFTFSSGLFMSKEEFSAIKKISDARKLWAFFPKQQINTILNRYSKNIYSCFMKKIFEYPLER